jgi:tetratricopeptide (TPR) repeat protein
MFSTTVIAMKWRAVTWCVLLSLGCAACEKRPYEKVRSQIIAADPQVQPADAALNVNAYDQAIAMYSEILSQRQENPLVYFKRGYAYYKAGQDQEAIADYTKALALIPEYAEAYAWRGVSYAFSGQSDIISNFCFQ